MCAWLLTNQTPASTLYDTVHRTGDAAQILLQHEHQIKAEVEMGESKEKGKMWLLAALATTRN